MSESNASSIASQLNPSSGTFLVSESNETSPSQAARAADFVDRRRSGSEGASSERRQFGSSHDGLSVAGRELARAIDQYKMQHHRRYITCDEMLVVLQRLGYRKAD